MKRSTLSLATLAREYVWLWDVRHGCSAATIAAAENLDVARVRRGVARTREIESQRDEGRATRLRRQPARVVPLFPIEYTPTSGCPHHGAIPPAPFYCVVCDRSYLDEHPDLCIVEPDPLPFSRGA
jgi:hypothetical protein